MRSRSIKIPAPSCTSRKRDNLDHDPVISAPNAQDAMVRRGVRALVGILILLTLAFCFFASSICITVILAAFLAVLVDPAVRALERLWIPRFIAAGLIVLTGVLACGFVIYESYGNLTHFSDEFPSYVSRIGNAISPIS